MWGTLQGDQFEQVAARFIPTHVGNTRSRRLMLPPPAVHPHACGEHTGVCEGTRGSLGSSPRMWGTHQRLLYVVFEIRFIPTHVGNTPIRTRCRQGPPVHPHACGEHSPQLLIILISLGSSPRMWGTHDRRPAEEVGDRFIPTHVGNTLCGRLGAGVVAVHPHACGEHLAMVLAEVQGVGSSPRMWGTPGPTGPGPRCRRFIPTHVGNTLFRAF